MNGKAFLSVFWLISVTLLASAAPVRLTEERMVVPTYLMGDPEPNPIFYDGRGSQGAQGRVYPYPLYDSLTNVRSNKAYRVIYLENEYVRIGILPEIGGRLFEAIDKSNGYNFVYRQHVIKPALIGLIGAWISGGIEWNIPHHHRATTALPVQSHVEEHADGSKTVWVGEMELRHRMRWAVSYTLRPGRSYLECAVRIMNRTEFANTMLCFANVAVHVNDDYQVIYPPATQFVTFHSKHEFTTWPIATTRNAGADFTRGVDVSWYSNHVSANSMFAWNYQDDFFAGYDHGRHAGILSVTDHRIVPGKKFWTWGNGPRGRMWDKILTDSDGPYIELMVGGYSDNQPDYSWLQPYETKSFEMYWYPFRDIDGVKNANLDAAVNLEVTVNGTAKLGFCTTAEHPSATVLLQAGNKTLLRQTCAIGPGKAYTNDIVLPPGVQETQLRASLTVDDRELVAYTPVRLGPAKMPDPVKDPTSPEKIETVEELYLAGQRSEQFHAANPSPESFWEEALRRDPGDARVNTAMAIRLLKQARFVEAEEHLHKAIERLTRNYTAPKDGEPFYYLGIALCGRALSESKPEPARDRAMDAFSKATWSQAWRAPAYFALAELASLRGQSSEALKQADHALEANTLSTRALGLKAALLRHAGKTQQALALLDHAVSTTDPLEPRFAVERWLVKGKKTSADFPKDCQRFSDLALELAAEYGNAGMWADGIAVLETSGSSDKDPRSPLFDYYRGEFYEHLGNKEKAATCRREAAQAPPRYVFPFQPELIPVLRHAIEREPQDARAPYYLGNLLFDWQPNEAVKLWERAETLDPSFAIVHRNLALAYSREATNDGTARAIGQLEKAVAAPTKYALHFSELDALYAKTGTPPNTRLALFVKNQEVIERRDDSLSREIGLLVFAGRYARAIQLMTGRKFSVWEGGTLEVAQHWVNAHLLRAAKEVAAGDSQAALADLEQAKNIPENLPNDSEGEDRKAEISYLQGLAFSLAGQAERSAAAWHQAADSCPQPTENPPVSARSVQIYFGALAENKLGRKAQADSMLRHLLDSAKHSLESPTLTETTSRRRNRGSSVALAHYLAGLANEGLEETGAAQEQFKLALIQQPDLLGAQVHLTTVPSK